jgi:hypothetical protein
LLGHEDLLSKTKKAGLNPTFSCHRGDWRQYIRGRRPAMASVSGGLQILCGALARTAILHDIEGKLLPFDDGAHASTLDSGNMDEDIRAAGVGLDETETLGGIEELHDSSVH